MKLKIVFGLFVFLSFFSNVSAQENYYVNENNVALTKEEYEFITDMFFDGYQKSLTLDDYNNIFIDDKVIDSEITSQTLILNNYSRATFHESPSKYFTIAKSCTSNCLITLVAEWKKNPNVRSYDVIGAYFENVSLESSPITTATNSSSTNSSSEMVSNQNGFGVSVKLPTGGNNMVVSQYFRVSPGGTVYGSYQHATANISLANSKKYTLSRSGYGGVFLFDSSVRNYYDAMGGVSISV
ncbi:MAG: hypothetical protein IJN13_00560 [Bacilli bacterium]|nr:hypothetical protein [Bacilli bacterium]